MNQSVSVVRLTLSRTQKTGLALALVMTGVAVAMGAVGSHIVAHTYPEGASTFAIALRYHTLHALGLVLLSLLASLWPRRLMMIVCGCFLVGSILFCGLLYLKSFGVLTATGFWVPAGGLSLISGWLIWGSGALWQVLREPS